MQEQNFPIDNTGNGTVRETDSRDSSGGLDPAVAAQQVRHS
jgi:hypothetical protein